MYTQVFFILMASFFFKKKGNTQLLVKFVAVFFAQSKMIPKQGF